MTVRERPVLSTQELGKRFDGIVALSGVDMCLFSGEIHAICGENGAGKSTLIKVLSGVHPRGSYDGAIRIDDEVCAFASVRDAEAQGIAVIYQELSLVDEMTIAENLFLGREPCCGPLVDYYTMNRRANKLIARLGIELEPEARVGTLGIGQKQLVEILRALGKKSRILILDEPTAALSESEARHLLTLLGQLKREGMACLYVSHRLEEVFEIADQITVLRDGRTVFSARREQTSRDEVVKEMVGRAVKDFFPKRQSHPGSVLLEVRGLTVEAPHEGGLELTNIEFDLRGGEVLGLGGLLGAGRSELLLHLYGAWGTRLSGQVWLRGEDYPEPSPHDSIARGLVLVTEDRKGTGLILGQSIAHNLVLSSLGRFAPQGLIDAEREFRAADEIYRRLKIKARDLEMHVGGLSGGNQQKVAVGKALMTHPKIIFLDEPTRGIDVGAKIEIYEIMNRLTDEGHAIVLASSELPELMAMSDRILMLGEGRMGGIFTHGAATPERLLDSAIAATESSRKERALARAAQARKIARTP